MTNTDRQRKRVAKLSVFEDKCWNFAFCYHKELGKQGDLEADRRTWIDMCKEFPRLLRYDGCR